jgi:Ca2+/Na+ antiporter
MNRKGKNSVIVLLSAIFVNVISSMVYAWVKTVDIITAFTTLWGMIFTLFKNILTFKIQVWQIILICFIFIFVVWLFIKYNGNKKYNHNVPEFMNFTTGVYKGIHYKWQIVNLYGGL